ncbi:MAG: cation:proton antiporter [Gammaproteobacteria bacterium]|nr:cation:proton antiporter [Gammaproteobacteria bacterium]
MLPSSSAVLISRRRQADLDYGNSRPIAAASRTDTGNPSTQPASDHALIMTISQWLLAISALLLTAHFLRRWSEKALLSVSVVAVLCGVVFSGLIAWFDIDTGLRWQSLSSLILQLLVPLMVFAGACRLSRPDIASQWRLSLFLCVPGLCISIFLCATLLYLTLKIAHPLGFELALLTAFILAAADPFCLSGYFRRHLCRGSVSILEKESIFTDAIIILGYTFLVLIHTSAAGDWSAGELAVFFVGNLAGELAVGAVGAVLTWRVVRHSSNPVDCQLFALACACLALGICQQLLLTSGLLAAFTIGLACGDATQRSAGTNDARRREHIALTELVEYICALFILALLGLSITFDMFAENWSVILCACAAVLGARAAVVALIPASYLEGLSRRWIFLGYSQCAVPAAVALSLPPQIESWYLVQSMVYGVAVMTLVVRGPALALALARAGRSGALDTPPR